MYIFSTFSPRGKASPFSIRINQEMHPVLRRIRRNENFHRITFPDIFRRIGNNHVIHPGLGALKAEG
jgi:hypothetical protein